MTGGDPGAALTVAPPCPNSTLGGGTGGAFLGVAGAEEDRGGGPSGAALDLIISLTGSHGFTSGTLAEGRGGAVIGYGKFG